MFCLIITYINNLGWINRFCNVLGSNKWERPLWMSGCSFRFSSDFMKKCGVAK
ncbi:hypothetical protein OBV_15260 [Oscillibacter valericigenes Sjm18-20]|nr:hypothetical protein OBV_15260 [Oscillibacter valericigenes Sjm18-20]